MAYEAFNNLTHFSKQRLIIILNDNGVSISPSIGGLHQHLLQLHQAYKIINASEVTAILDQKMTNVASGNFFETFGARYLGIVDGRDLSELVQILQIIKTNDFSYLF